MIALALLLTTAEPAPDRLQTLDGFARRGAVIDRMGGLAAETAPTCAAACSLNDQCQAWTWRAGWIGQAGRCDLHALALTPAPHPGAATGLSSGLAARIDAAIDRAPDDRERAALDDASRARPSTGNGLAGG